MITYVKGDLFAANERAIAHGCNCHGVMGAGVAKIVRDQFPRAFHDYRDACTIDQFYPGCAQPVVCEVFTAEGHETGEVTTVYNLATQNAPGPNAKYEWVEAAFRNMLQHMHYVGNKRIAMPMIGAGIGGLDWMFVHRILQATFPHTFDVVVYYLNDSDLPEVLRARLP